MGNICRSPAAEIIFDQIVRDHGKSSEFVIDSAGTLGFHSGKAPDHRMQASLVRRGYRVFGVSRKIEAQDLAKFDHVLVMDAHNEWEVIALDETGEHRHKIRRLTNHCREHRMDHVPDPYSGGNRDFEDCVDLIEDACRGLFADLTKDQQIP
jgi:protein-tyrosine phosphatase